MLSSSSKKCFGLAMIAAAAGLPLAAFGADGDDKDDAAKARSPIKHVSVLIGENRSFDHLFATYVPKSNDTILNLLSERIVRADGSPGPQFARAKQFTTAAEATYFIGVNPHNKTPYTTL